MTPIPYTISWDSIVSEITTSGAVSEAFSPAYDSGSHPDFSQINLLWDTGAIKSMISNQLANRLKLIPVGLAHNVNTSGITTVHRYRINLLLPNNVEISELEVISDELPDTDMLIGMDVIGLCDMAITHSQVGTMFSFRIPSNGQVDFSTDS